MGFNANPSRMPYGTIENETSLKEENVNGNKKKEAAFHPSPKGKGFSAKKDKQKPTKEKTMENTEKIIDLENRLRLFEEEKQNKLDEQTIVGLRQKAARLTEIHGALNLLIHKMNALSEGMENNEDGGFDIRQAENSLHFSEIALLRAIF